MSSITVLLAEDHTLVRSGLRAMLEKEPDIKVVGEAKDGREAVDRALELLPDVVVMDLTMPTMDGFEAICQLKAKVPQMRFLVLTVHEDVGYLYQALKAGASGYVTKRAAHEELVMAIRAVHSGEAYIHSAMTSPVVEAFLQRPSPRPPKEPDIALSGREKEVLRLVASGYTNQEIAEQLSISVRTVETHRAHIIGKLKLKKRAELVNYAVRLGLLNSPPPATSP